MTRLEFDDIIRESGADTKNCRFNWDGYKCTYFSLSFGENKELSGRIWQEGLWTFQERYHNTFLTTVIHVGNLISEITNWVNFNKED